MQFTSVESTTLKKTLLGLESWEERVNKVAELVTESRTAVGVSSHQNERQQVRHCRCCRGHMGRIAH